MSNADRPDARYFAGIIALVALGKFVQTELASGRTELTKPV